MSRVIKFRAWHKTEKKIYPVVGMLFSLVMLAPSENTLGGIPIDDLELMQFTGLQDKNGREIYEGDILRVPGNYVAYGTHNAAVEWSEKQLGWVTSSGLKMLNSSPDAPPELEIIGNIYENPELAQSSQL